MKQTAFITGATSGIGKATATIFAKNNIRLILCGRRIEKLKDKIKKMRKAGLETGGEYSVENIVFKLLRRNDIMEKLGNLSTNAYDDEYTIDEELLWKKE